MNWRKGFVLLGLLSLAVLLTASSTNSFSTGIDRTKGLPEDGCICHGPNKADDGEPNPAVALVFRVDGNPFRYAAGQAYNVTVGAAASDVAPKMGSNQGGFNLQVNVGTLAAGPGFEDFVQLASDKEATHTDKGDLHGRTFNLTWTAPAEPEGAAVFKLFVNTVNGNGQNDEGDHWNGGVFVIPDETGKIGAAEAENPEHIGVNWLAHWVGIVSFVAVVVTLLLYYFVLKYGETVHTTDHRDRKEK